MNRLSQHLAAIGLSPPQPVVVPPAKGDPHYALVTFNVDTACRDWWPRSVDDAPTRIEYEHVEFRGRHTTLQGALAELRAFNLRALTFPPVEWATIVFVEMGPRDVLDHFARTVIPFRYCVLELRPPAHWIPESLLDAPPGPWNDELVYSELPRVRSLEGVVRRAANYNRRFRERKDKAGFGHIWRTILALEHDPLSQTTVVDGRRTGGTLSAHSAGRFHVVGADWPGAAEAMEGGGHHV